MAREREREKKQKHIFDNGIVENRTFAVGCIGKHIENLCALTKIVDSFNNSKVIA